LPESPTRTGPPSSPAPDTGPLHLDTQRVIVEINNNLESSLRAVSAQADPRAGSDEQKASKRSIFRRAIDRIGSPKSNDLGNIEDMLSQLLVEVDELKTQTQPAGDSGVLGVVQEGGLNPITAS
jgi:hypothetical protein